MLLPPDHPISCGEIALRPWRRDDLPCIEEASTDPAIAETAMVPSPYSKEAGEAFIERMIGRSHEGPLSFAIAHEDSAVGSVFAAPRGLRGVVGLAYWVAPSQRRRGFASMAVRAVSDWLIDLPEVARVEAWVEPANVGSATALRRAGFEYEGHLRNYFPLSSRRASVDVYSRVSG